MEGYFSVVLLESYYPRMGAYGFSSEGQMGPGIFFFEAGSYISYEDLEGEDPLIENSLDRLLLGYRFQVGANFSVGTQVMSEKMDNYDNYLKYLMAGQIEKKEIRNTYSLRLSQTAQQQTLQMSVFIYTRPENHDSYLRFNLKKRLDDQFEVGMGANIFIGDDDYLDSEFGTLRDDDNLYARVKYIF